MLKENYKKKNKLICVNYTTLCTRVNTSLEVALIRQLCRVSSQKSMKRYTVMILKGCIDILIESVPEVTVVQLRNM